MFIDLNDGTWKPDPPDIDQAEAAMLAIAAGEADETWTAAWLIERIHSHARIDVAGWSTSGIRSCWWIRSG